MTDRERRSRWVHYASTDTETLCGRSAEYETTTNADQVDCPECRQKFGGAKMLAHLPGPDDTTACGESRESTPKIVPIADAEELLCERCVTARWQDAGGRIVELVAPAFRHVGSAEVEDACALWSRLHDLNRQLKLRLGAPAVEKAQDGAIEFVWSSPSRGRVVVRSEAQRTSLHEAIAPNDAPLIVSARTSLHEAIAPNDAPFIVSAPTDAAIVRTLLRLHRIKRECPLKEQAGCVLGFAHEGKHRRADGKEFEAVVHLHRSTGVAPCGVATDVNVADRIGAAGGSGELGLGSADRKEVTCVRCLEQSPPPLEEPVLHLPGPGDTTACGASLERCTVLPLADGEHPVCRKCIAAPWPLLDIIEENSGAAGALYHQIYRLVLKRRLPIGAPRVSVGSTVRLLWDNPAWGSVVLETSNLDDGDGRVRLRVRPNDGIEGVTVDPSDDAITRALAAVHRLGHEQALPPEQTGQKTRQGVRYNTGKLRWHLVPWDAVRAVAEIIEYGAAKYEPRNWEKGLPFSETFDSLQRHLLAWWSGEDVDKESGRHHLAHAGINVLFLLAFAVRDRGDLDDRPHRIDAVGMRPNMDFSTGAEKEPPKVANDG